MHSIRVGLGRSNVVVAVCVGLFLGGISVVSIVGSVRDPGAPLGYFIGGLFGLVFVFFLVKIGPVLRPRSFEFAPDGFRFWHGRDSVHIPWQHVLAVGIGYETKPQDPPELKIPMSVDDAVEAAKDRLKEQLTDRLTEFLQVSGERRLGLEIYPRAPEAFAAYPRLQPYIRRQPPPRYGLPPDAWRLPLPPVVAIAREAGRGMSTFFPAAWLGWYPRVWMEPAS